MIPLQPFIPRATSIRDGIYNQDVIKIPNKVFRNQIYYQIEILPTKYLDGTEKFIIPVDNPVLLGFLTSSLFAVWVRGIGDGKEIVVSEKTMYNNFPFPVVSKTQSESIERAVNYVFEARAEAGFERLADIYVPESMPEYLRKAHENLDSILFPIFDLPTDASNEEVLKTLFDKYLQLLNQD